MLNRILVWTFGATLLIVTASAGQETGAAPIPRIGTQERMQVARGSGLPLTFEENQGQTSAEARFVARGKGYSAFLTAGGMVLSLRPPKAAEGQEVKRVNTAQGSSELLQTVLQFNLLGAAQNPVVTGEDQQRGRVNYFIGKDPKRWRTNVAIYGKVRYKNVYPGIDLVYYGNHRQLEYDFEIAKGANPNLIQFEIKGANQIRLDERGDLILVVNSGELHFKSPIVYQQIRGQRVILDGGYVAKDATHIAFRLAHYDPTKPLVIDPVLLYSTYLGGTGDDETHAIAVDGGGSIYVAGSTTSFDFPGTAAGGLDLGLLIVFVAKLDSTGSLVYADYLGSGGGDVGTALAVNSSNEVYVTGSTGSDLFPTTDGAYQSSLRGYENAFLSKLSSDGAALLYSTYLGGSGSDNPTSVAVDSLGNVFVAGMTGSQDFPTQAAFQPAMSANAGGMFGRYGFLTEFSLDGSSLVYSTYLGGSAMVIQTCWDGPCWFPPFNRITGIQVDANDNAYVVGYTNTSDFPTTSGAYLTSNTNVGPGQPVVNSFVGFVAKFNSSGSPDYSTYLYGQNGIETIVKAIAVDGSGSAYVTGETVSDGTFPIKSTTICDPGVSGEGCNYTFVTKLDAGGTSLLYSTFLGSGNHASPQAIALDANGDAYILGMTWTCPPFTMVNGIEPCVDVASSQLLLVEIDPTAATELFATYLGGTDDEDPAGLALDSLGNIYVGGETYSSDFPTTLGAYQSTLNGISNAFLVKIGPDSGAAFSASPFLLEYGSHSVGSTSAPATATLRNMGSAPLSISAITVSGDFTQTNDCGNTVAAAGSCTFSATFAPTAAGVRSGSILIQDDAAGSPHAITLMGYAPGPIAALSPANLIFSGQSVGTSGATQAVTLANTGDMALTIGGIETTGDFSQTNNCAATVSPGSSCVITITFNPTTFGARSGTLTLSDNAQSPETLNLSGTGLDFILASSTNTGTVKAGAAAAVYQLTITPRGGPFGNPIALSCDGLPASTTCSFSPSAVTPGGNPAQATLTVATSTSLTAARPPLYLFGNGRLPAIWITLPCLLLFGIVLTQRRGLMNERKLSILAIPTILALLLMTACAGYSVHRPATALPAGTYNITVVGSSSALQHSVSLTLIIQ